MNKKKITVGILIMLLCISFTAEGVFAAEAASASEKMPGAERLQTYVPGYGDVDPEELGLTEEEIEQYEQQINNIDFSDPEAADAQIREMAESAGYSISDSDAESIRQLLDDGTGGSASAEEIKGMYEAYKDLGEELQDTENLLDTIMSFLKKIVMTIKDWFTALFHLN